MSSLKTARYHALSYFDVANSLRVDVVELISSWVPTEVTWSITVSVAKEIAHFCEKEKFDIIICGRESIDYNGGIVPGVISGMLDYNFITNCVNLDIKGSTAEASREIDGGIETVECDLPLVVGSQKGLVEESDLIIPNMRGIMMARQKPLETIDAQNFEIESENKTFHKPEAKKEVKLVKANEVDKLIDLLENEAKVI